MVSQEKKLSYSKPLVKCFNCFAGRCQAKQLRGFGTVKRQQLKIFLGEFPSLGVYFCTQKGIYSICFLLSFHWTSMPCHFAPSSQRSEEDGLLIPLSNV